MAHHNIPHAPCCNAARDTEVAAAGGVFSSAKLKAPHGRWATVEESTFRFFRNVDARRCLPGPRRFPSRGFLPWYRAALEIQTQLLFGGSRPHLCDGFQGRSTSLLSRHTHSLSPFMPHATRSPAPVQTSPLAAGEARRRRPIASIISTAMTVFPRLKPRHVQSMGRRARDSAAAAAGGAFCQKESDNRLFTLGGCEFGCFLN
jgi:hypothetical protein